MSIKTYPIDIASELKTEKDIDGFIEASIEEAKNDTDPKYLIHALETAAVHMVCSKLPERPKLTVQVFTAFFPVKPTPEPVLSLKLPMLLAIALLLSSKQVDIFM